MRVGGALRPMGDWPGILEAATQMPANLTLWVSGTIIIQSSLNGPMCSAGAYADELNVYADEELLRYAREQIALSGRNVEVSVYRHIDGGRWPSGLRGELRRWEELHAAASSSTSGLTPTLCNAFRNSLPPCRSTTGASRSPLKTPGSRSPYSDPG
jgi:hypothetical protein